MPKIMILPSDSYIVRHRIRVVFCCCGSWKCQIVDVVVIFITFSVKTVQCSVSTSTSSREDRLVKTFCHQYQFNFIILIVLVNFHDNDVSAQDNSSYVNLLSHTNVLSTPVINKNIRYDARDDTNASFTVNML